MRLQGNSQQVFDVPSQFESSIAENFSIENDAVFTEEEIKMTGSEDKTTEIENSLIGGLKFPIIVMELHENSQQSFDVHVQFESSC